MILDHGNRLDFNEQVRVGEPGHGDQGAGRFPVGEVLLPDLDELISVTDVDDEHGHRDEILKLASRFFQGRLQVTEDAVGLGRENPPP